MKAHYQLAKHAIHDMGYTVSVWDGGDWQVKRSTSLPAVMDAIESVDVSELKFRNSDGDDCGWASIVLGNDGGDEVSDYSVSREAVTWIDTWFNKTVMGA